MISSRLLKTLWLGVCVSITGVAFSFFQFAHEFEEDLGLASQLSKLEEQIYNLKRQRLDALINDKLLEKEAAKRKLTAPQLLDAEATSKVGLVTEHQDNEAQIKSNDPQLPN
jgi:hypothetical protein